ncbi:MAG: hypothetical protein FWG74_02315 [Planctomycetes bacterium]|nr:hypothetical protein [Planctomycetota bacterium]
MKKRLSQSTILNLGSLITFVAFIFLYTGLDNDNYASMLLGMALIVVSMFAPFLSRFLAKQEK